MTESEAFESIVTRQEAIDEIERHQCDVSAFFADVEPLPSGMYRGADVLDWLGY